MALLPKPTKPLKILTIDGGGLQGISTLLILDKLLDAIARNNQVHDSKPRPCEVFDVIAGIGAGGWLALLLGRFQMDVSAALAEWYNLIDCIMPRSKVEELRLRLIQHSYFDTTRLMEQIDHLTDFYETDKHMFFTPPNGTRCKHVFVSGLKTDAKGTHLGYNLFRTYDCPENSMLLDGPSDPRKYRISHAFGVTGAAKYFTAPWKEHSATKGKSRFLDVNSPSVHNITKLALDEMWGLYGRDVDISVVVNVGPGDPNASDCRQIARRFSWGKKVATTSPAFPNRGRTSGAKEVTAVFNAVVPHGYKQREEFSHNEPKISYWDNSNQDPPANVTGDTAKETLTARQSTFGFDRNVGIDEKLRKDETTIKDDIRSILRNVYKEDTPLYFRLAPERSAPGAVQNDTSSPKASSDAIRQYLQLPSVEASMEDVGQRIQSGIPVPVG